MAGKRILPKSEKCCPTNKLKIRNLKILRCIILAGWNIDLRLSCWALRGLYIRQAAASM